MANPSEKSPEMNNTLNKITKSLFGRERSDSIQKDICVFCGKPANEFRDNLSKKEYTISGMCQSCQDSVFEIKE